MAAYVWYPSIYPLLCIYPTIQGVPVEGCYKEATVGQTLSLSTLEVEDQVKIK